jgi:hypothetical protein
MNKPKIINFPKIIDPRGNLTFFESNSQIPFVIERVFWIYDVPGGSTRGGHAYIKQHEIIIALSGSFDVIVKSKNNIIETFRLNRSYYGLYLPPLCWRHIENFSTNALSLNISSSKFNESDYIRDFESFCKI